MLGTHHFAGIRLAYLYVVLVIVMHCHRVDFIVRKSRITAFLYLAEDIVYTLVYVLVFLAETLRKEFIVLCSVLQITLDYALEMLCTFHCLLCFNQLNNVPSDRNS